MTGSRYSDASVPDGLLFSTASRCRAATRWWKWARTSAPPLPPAGGTVNPATILLRTGPIRVRTAPAEHSDERVHETSRPSERGRGPDDGRARPVHRPGSQLSALIHTEVDGRVASRCAQQQTVPMRARNRVGDRTWPVRSVTLLKVDCEGAEYDILERLTPDTAALVSQVAMEVHRVPGYSVDSVPARPAALGFDVRKTIKLAAYRRTPTRSRTGKVTVAARFRPARARQSPETGIGEPATAAPAIIATRRELESHVARVAKAAQGACRRDGTRQRGPPRRSSTTPNPAWPSRPSGQRAAQIWSMVPIPRFIVPTRSRRRRRTDTAGARRAGPAGAPRSRSSCVNSDCRSSCLLIPKGHHE